jgi:hypothetical protein
MRVVRRIERSTEQKDSPPVLHRRGS